MARIHYARTDEFWRRGEKYDFLDTGRDVTGIDWRVIEPNAEHTWLTEGLEAEFDTFLPIGTQEAKAGTENAIFVNYGSGVATSKDAWAYNFDRRNLANNMARMINVYNEHVDKWIRLGAKPRVDDFISTDSKKISWSRDLKLDMQRGNLAEFGVEKVRTALHRPFTRQYLYFDRIMNEEVYQLPSMLPIAAVESHNRMICVSDKAHRESFSALATNSLPDFHLVATKDRIQCFPFYTYDEDGSNRRENITDWALDQFRSHYGDPYIDKWAIFHFVYALLHHPAYREKYAANLRRSLPRIPFAPEFRPFAQAGARLAELHVRYEEQAEYPLRWVENPDAAMSFRVEKMKLSRDKSSLHYNDFLTLDGIPPAVFDYRLGNRSALEWVIDRYRVTTDRRSGIVNDPNAWSDDAQYIVKLIGKVVTVSLETVAIVAGLPALIADD